jgi:perosamine synthetase
MEKYTEIIEFIRQTFNQSEGFIPLHNPIFNGNEKKYASQCIDSTFVSSVGEFVDLFEEKIASYTGSKKAVACVNGTNALYLALKLVGVENDSEVITQPLTFIATVNPICYCGAKPVFLDIDRDTLGLSPEALNTWLHNIASIKSAGNKAITINKTTGRHISACIPMHTYGHPARIDEIVTICNQYNIPVVEDAAESLGSYYKGQHTGTFGKIGILSFNGNKIITTGGGGMLLFQDEVLASRAKHLTIQAKVSHPWAFFHDETGYNFRMPNINAALGLAQLEQLPQLISAKRSLAESYSNFFARFTPTITFVPEPDNARSNYWLNALILENREQREEFLEITNRNGVMTRPAWELMNRLPMFINAQCDDLTNSKSIAETLVNIPSSAVL